MVADRWNSNEEIFPIIIDDRSVGSIQLFPMIDYKILADSQHYYLCKWHANCYILFGSGRLICLNFSALCVTTSLRKIMFCWEDGENVIIAIVKHNLEHKSLLF